MLRSVKEMTGYTVRATDGEVGRVTDFYIDDERWTVRYVVVATGEAGATSRGPVLISPMTVTNPDFDNKRFDLSLTREQVLNSPDVESDKTVSRAWEERYAKYYNLSPYWTGTGLWGNFANAIDAAAAPLAGFPLVPNRAAEANATPGAQEAAAAPGDAAPSEAAPSESHLRSSGEVIGYNVQASDGSAGNIEDLLADDRSWQVLHFVVDTTRWWPGGEVVVPVDLARQVDWARQQITVEQTREEIKRRAEFRPSSLTG